MAPLVAGDMSELPRVAWPQYAGMCGLAWGEWSSKVRAAYVDPFGKFCVSKEGARRAAVEPFHFASQSREQLENN